MAGIKNIDTRTEKDSDNYYPTKTTTGLFDDFIKKFTKSLKAADLMTTGDKK